MYYIVTANHEVTEIGTEGVTRVERQDTFDNQARGNRRFTISTELYKGSKKPTKADLKRLFKQAEEKVKAKLTYMSTSYDRKTGFIYLARTVPSEDIFQTQDIFEIELYENETRTCVADAIYDLYKMRYTGKPTIRGILSWCTEKNISTCAFDAHHQPIENSRYISDSRRHRAAFNYIASKAHLEYFQEVAKKRSHTTEKKRQALSITDTVAHGTLCSSVEALREYINTHKCKFTADTLYEPSSVYVKGSRVKYCSVEEYNNVRELDASANCVADVLTPLLANVKPSYYTSVMREFLLANRALPRRYASPCEDSLAQLDMKSAYSTLLTTMEFPVFNLNTRWMPYTGQKSLMYLVSYAPRFSEAFADLPYATSVTCRMADELGVKYQKTHALVNYDVQKINVVAGKFILNAIVGHAGRVSTVQRVCACINDEEVAHFAPNYSIVRHPDYGLLAVKETEHASDLKLFPIWLSVVSTCRAKVYYGCHKQLIDPSLVFYIHTDSICTPESNIKQILPDWQRKEDRICMQEHNCITKPTEWIEPKSITVQEIDIESPDALASSITNILSHPRAIISGPAGAGKSTVLREIAKRFKNPMALAFTNSAARLIKGQTIHSAFRIADDTHCIPDADVLLIDEYSMIPTTLHACILDFKGPIYLFGDINQLPPVEGSPWHTIHYEFPIDFRLTKVLRVAGEYKGDLTPQLTICYTNVQSDYYYIGQNFDNLPAWQWYQITKTTHADDTCEYTLGKNELFQFVGDKMRFIDGFEIPKSHAINYPYEPVRAITVHASQGQTFRFPYEVDTAYFEFCPNQKELTYVAKTRGAYTNCCMEVCRYLGDDSNGSYATYKKLKKEL